MTVSTLRQNANPGQIAVNLIGRTVADSKPAGIAHSASIMDGNPQFFTVRNPPPPHTGGIGRNLDITA